MNIQRLCAVSLLWSIVLAPSSFATTFNFTPASNWVGFFNTPGILQPGDEIILGAGIYSTTTRLSIGYIGTAAMPITVRAADGANVVLTRPNANQNVLNIEGAQHFKLKGIEITGGSAGIRIGQRNSTQAKFVTLDGLHIHDTGNAGVTANYSGQTYEGMHFLNNEIHDTSAEGEGFYLGCNNNACQFYDGVIEKNYIHDLNGPTISQGDGIEIKDGSYNNIIRDNVIHDTNFPGILVYGVEEQGGRNIIERNVLWDIDNHAIQAAADFDARNNLIFSADFDGIHSQNHQGAVPGNFSIINNTIRTSGSAIDIGTPSGGYSGSVDIINNALYPIGSDALQVNLTAGVNSSNNVGTGNSSGLPFDSSGNLNTDFIDFLNKNGFPAAASTLIGAGLAISQPSDDFNTTSRSGSNDVGAYVYNASGNPGWNVVPGFKGFPAAGQAGDFDGDLDVDGHDFLKWQRDGADPGDFLDWEANFGTLAPLSGLAAAAVVPEPSSMVLFAIGFAFRLRRRSRSGR